MKRIAVLGAGGFVGTRLVEFAALTGAAEVIPVIRSLKSAASLSRFGRNWVLANANSPGELGSAIANCDAVVNCTVGELNRLAATTTGIWESCAAMNVPRLVHISSAEVFGRAEEPDMHDDSPPVARHWMQYARAKAAAEQALRPRLGDKRLCCIVLRPGLVWGPRSPWVEKPASQLLASTAFLLGGGRGICNLLYVDNLIFSILGVVESREAPSGFYNVADDELIRWCDYYAALARELKVDFSEIHQLPAGPFKQTLSSRLEALKDTTVLNRLKLRLGKPTKERLKKVLSLLKTPVPDSGPVPPPRPIVTRSDWHLQNTLNKLPTSKFTRAFGRLNRLSFEEAMSLTGEWLRFAGFARS